MEKIKKFYAVPELTAFGEVTEVTAAVGGGGKQDQSDYPQFFPPGKGSYDICNNKNPNSVC